MFQIRPVGIPVHVPVKPGDDQRTVGPLVLAPPLTLAVPVHRCPTPVAVGAEIVNVPVKLMLSVVPVIVPFQSFPLLEAHVPVTVLDDCDSRMSTA